MPPLFSREINIPVISDTALRFQMRTSPCEDRCPAGNPIQKIQALLKENSFERAVEFLRAKNPFPGTTGRICTHPCEEKCNRHKYDEAVNIKGLERAAVEFADMARVKKPFKMERSGKKIAVIGGGPAGLTCAYFSCLFGHDVTVFEAGPILGGMPRLNVPDYRLPKDILDMEIGLVLEAGVKARTNTGVGRDISFEDIRKSFDAVCIATGTWKERRLDIPGADKALKGVEFLRQVNLGRIREAGRKTIIVGGGGVAFDCAFTAKRLGAEEVHIVCLEKADAMCAPPDDLVQARQEGIIIHSSRMVSRVLEKKGKIAGIEWLEVAKFFFDDAGQAHAEPASEKGHTLSGDTVILAVGVQPELGFLEGTGIAVKPDGTIKTDTKTMATSVSGAFAAGDTATGPSIAANAIGQGRQVAFMINRYLTGGPGEYDVLVIGEDNTVRSDSAGQAGRPHVVTFEEMFNPEHYEKTPRNDAAVSSVISFLERDEGFDSGTAMKEASRCFHCGHCHACGKCVEDCPGSVLVMSDRGPEVAYPDECWHCGNCRISCPDAAVTYEFPLYTLV